MYLRIHKNARVSFPLRREIREGSGSVNSLALKYGLSWKQLKSDKREIHLKIDLPGHIS